MILIRKISLGILLLTGSSSLYGMECIEQKVKQLRTKILQQFYKSMQTPKIEFEKPIKILKTPLASGTLENEAENVIQQINVVLDLYKVGTESIVKCSVVVSKDDYKDRVLKFFKSKKFKPRKIEVNVIDLKDIKVAVDIIIYNESKQKDKLPKQAKL